MDWILASIGWVLSIISIAIAIYQYKNNKRYKYIIKTNSWMLFQRINNLGGIIQKLFIDTNGKDIEKGLYEKIVRSDALSSELYKEAIRLIMISEENVTERTIDKWRDEGKIAEDYSKLFKAYLPSEE